MLELMTSTIGTCQKCGREGERIVLTCHYDDDITGRALFLCRVCLYEHASHCLTVTKVHALPVQFKWPIGN